MNVAIFGSGISGIITAITLQLQGHSCAVYERSRLALDSGMGFILMPEAITYMEKLGIQIAGDSTPAREQPPRAGDPGDCGGVPLDRYICRDITGEVLHAEAMPLMSRSIRRFELISALIERARLKGAINFDAELEQLEFDEQSHVAAAVLSRGRRITADVFVAADGSRSLIRHTLFPHWPVKARVREVVGLVRCPEATQWAGHNFNKFHAAGGGLAVGILPVGGDHVVWFMQFDSFRFQSPPSRDASRQDWRDFVLKMTGSWAFPVAPLVASTDLHDIHIWFPLDVDLVPYFHCGNVVLVGDAAHPLSPFTSQGVASAIADAVTLANVLPETNDKGLLDKALAFYSKQRRQQCVRYLNAGRELTQKFLAPVNNNNFVIPLAT